MVLTDRYVWFWNQLILKMRAKNPRAKIGVYLYSAYRNPPKKLRVEAGIVGEMVHGFDFSHWIAWQQAGVEEIGLRPNWLYMGACGPHLPLSVAGHYIEQARSHQMSIISMDCLHEYWATQGPYYYLIARLVSRPDLTTREIRAEYCDAFGDAADVIAEYLDFWEAYHRQVGYNVPAGGSVGIDPDGLYARVSQEHFGQIMHPLRGHWKTLSHIYMPQIMREAGQILDRASSLTADTLTRGRIDFLRDGLRMVELAAHYMTAQEAADDAGMRTDLGHLKRFGDNMREKHGYWHSKDIFFLMWWGLIGDEYAVSPGQ